MTSPLESGLGPPSQGHPREDFYAVLGEINEFSQVAHLGLYATLPGSWWVMITDVRGSTRAIEAGRYRDVNALGAASIVALRNAAPDLELPYVFGGDGATVLVPGSRLEAFRSALRGVRALAHEAFDLDLRVGNVSVKDLARAGHAVRVARFRASPGLCLAMLSGSGLTVAEAWIKDESSGPRHAVSEEGEASANLEGFECRWQPVPSRRGRVVSLLILALGGDEAETAREYEKLLDVLERELGASSHGPVHLKGLRLRARLADFETEARVRSGRSRGPALARAQAFARKKAWIGRALIAAGASAGGFDGKTYRSELVENTDFRKFDETLRMVLDLSPESIERLEQLLERERASGRIVYGLHQAEAALVTCQVRSYSQDHVHFVDGADGGYALAAKQLKAQLAALR